MPGRNYEDTPDRIGFFGGIAFSYRIQLFVHFDILRLCTPGSWRVGLQLATCTTSVHEHAFAIPSSRERVSCQATSSWQSRQSLPTSSLLLGAKHLLRGTALPSKGYRSFEATKPFWQLQGRDFPCPELGRRKSQALCT